MIIFKQQSSTNELIKSFSSFLADYAICLFFLSELKMKTICIAIFAILIVSTTARSYRRGKYHSAIINVKGTDTKSMSKKELAGLNHWCVERLFGASLS